MLGLVICLRKSVSLANLAGSRWEELAEGTEDAQGAGGPSRVLAVDQRRAG